MEKFILFCGSQLKSTEINYPATAKCYYRGKDNLIYECVFNHNTIDVDKAKKLNNSIFKDEIFVFDNESLKYVFRTNADYVSLDKFGVGYDVYPTLESAIKLENSGRLNWQTFDIMQRLCEKYKGMNVNVNSDGVHLIDVWRFNEKLNGIFWHYTPVVITYDANDGFDAYLPEIDSGDCFLTKEGAMKNAKPRVVRLEETPKTECCLADCPFAADMLADVLKEIFL